MATFTKNLKGKTVMLVQVLKSKLLRAEATDARVDYEGSLAIDQDLMDKYALLPTWQICEDVWKCTL